ncbi:hypothetical protein N9Y42_03225 [Mariniblastus sp.]|nr:hypothetical protein [Mariniblastus sp.]
MIRIYLGLVIVALAILTGPSSAEAQCAYSSGYSSYSPSYQYADSYYTPTSSYSSSYYDNSYYTPSYGYGNGYSSNYYAPSSRYRSNYNTWGNSTRGQRIRTIATVALVAGAVVAISNSGSRNRFRRNRW